MVSYYKTGYVPFCENNGIVVIEDEYHFLLHCPRYNTIREKYLKKTSGAIYCY